MIAGKMTTGKIAIEKMPPEKITTQITIAEKKAKEIIIKKTQTEWYIWNAFGVRMNYMF